MRPTIASALALRIHGVHLAAVINEQARTYRIEQRGEAKEEYRQAIEDARAFLAARVKRVYPLVRLTK